MKRSGLKRQLLALLVGALLFAPAITEPVMAQSYDDYQPRPTRPTRPRPNTDYVGPTIGLGLSILQGIRQHQQNQPPPDYYEPPARPRPHVVPPRVQKPYRQKPSRSTRQTRPPKKPQYPSRIVLPQTLRTAMAKPRIYSISDKPWSSEDVFVVMLTPDLTDDDIKSFLADYDLELVEQTRIKLLDQVVLKLAYPEDMSPRDALLMATDRRVFRAQPDYFYYPAASAANETAEPLAELQYAFDKLGLNRLEGDANGQGVRLAVIDSSISTKHPALKDVVADRFSPFADRESVKVSTEHGTAIASILSAQAGMRGIAKGADLISAEVFQLSEAGHTFADSFDIVRGIDWAVESGARILNLSFAGAQDQLLEDVLAKAAQAGVIAVAAAGNEGAQAPVAYPAAYGSVIAVTATDEVDDLYSFANRGQPVELAAPGVDVLVAAGEDGYGLQSGTSMATAYISGAIALLLEKEPDLGLLDVKLRLTQSTADLGQKGRDPAFGYGRLDAYKALTLSSANP